MLPGRTVLQVPFFCGLLIRVAIDNQGVPDCNTAQARQGSVAEKGWIRFAVNPGSGWEMHSWHLPPGLYDICLMMSKCFRLLCRMKPAWESQADRVQAVCRFV